jgi:hypothetical protein
MTDLEQFLSVIKERVRNALVEFTGTEPEIADLNARSEPRSAPYARIGVPEVGHDDLTVPLDRLVVGVQIIAVVDRKGKPPQTVQFELTKAILLHLFGENHELCLIELDSGRSVRIVPSTRVTFISDVESIIAERAPDCTSVVIMFGAELYLGGKVI